MEVIDYSLLLGRWPADLESELDLPIGYIRDDMVARGESATEIPSSVDKLDGGTARLKPSGAAGRTMQISSSEESKVRMENGSIEC